MDPELKKFIKSVTFSPVFLWLPIGMSLLFIEAIFKGHEYHNLIALVCTIAYVVCIMMFLRGLKKSTEISMKRIEERHMEFITNAINRGAGRAKYIVPVPEIEGFWRKKRMELFGTTYIRPYTASYVDTGMEYMKAHLEVPVSKKQAFQLRLMGCYETDDRERAKKALEYLGVEWPLP